MIRLLIFLALICNVMAIGTKSFDIVGARLNDRGHPYHLGTVELDVGSLEASYRRANTVVQPDGPLCVGLANEHGDFECMSVANIDEHGVVELTLYLDERETVRDIDYVEHSTTVSDGRYENADVVSVVTSINDGPLPLLKEPVKLVNGHLQEREQEKTFLQKYWVFIVPIVLLTLVSSGGQQ
jgi:hypothetical protein